MSTTIPTAPTVFRYTPWGRPDDVTVVRPGVWFITTPSHGGYYVDTEHNEAVPLAWRRASHNRQAVAGWYEEDIDWCMVALTFPEAFPADAAEPARGTFDHWINPKLEAV